jgi:hypothetical protein
MAPRSRWSRSTTPPTPRSSPSTRWEGSGVDGAGWSAAGRRGPSTRGGAGRAASAGARVCRAARSCPRWAHTQRRRHRARPPLLPQPRFTACRRSWCSRTARSCPTATARCGARRRAGSRAEGGPAAAARRACAPLCMPHAVRAPLTLPSPPSRPSFSSVRIRSPGRGDQGHSAEVHRRPHHGHCERLSTAAVSAGYPIGRAPGPSRRWTRHPGRTPAPARRPLPAGAAPPRPRGRGERRVNRPRGPAPSPISCERRAHDPRECSPVSTAALGQLPQPWLPTPVLFGRVNSPAPRASRRGKGGAPGIAAAPPPRKPLPPHFCLGRPRPPRAAPPRRVLNAARPAPSPARRARPPPL